MWQLAPTRAPTAWPMGSGTGALPSCRLRDRHTIESIANQSHGISRTLLAGRSVHGAISTRDVRPTEGSHAPAAGVNVRGRFSEAGFQRIFTNLLRFSHATRQSTLRPSVGIFA